MNTKTELLIIVGCKSPLNNGFHSFLYVGFDNPVACFNCAEKPQFRNQVK